VNKDALAGRADGKKSLPSEGPRAKATGEKEIIMAKDSGRGTKNPVK